MVKLSRKRIIALVLCALFVVGGIEVFIDRGKTDLVFSDVKVECSNRDGLSGDRYAKFTLSGTVTRQTWRTAREEDMPRLVTGEEGYEEILPRLTDEQLSRGESCSFIYEHEFDITDNALSTLSYTCDRSTEGFDEALEKVNSGLKGVVDEYARKDAEKRAAEEEAERKAAEEEANKRAVEGCKGKTTDEGMKIAKDAGYTVTFVDNAGADVTKEVEDSTDGSEARASTIKIVEIVSSERKEVTFTLDFEGAETKKAREEEEAKRKAEEEAKRPPHITYAEIDSSAIRENRGGNSSVYVVIRFRANCEKDSTFYDQVTINCKVNDREPYDMRPLPAEWDIKDNEGRSYSNELLQCTTRFDANPGDTVSFWIDDPSTGATYEGLDGLAEQLTTITQDAINTPPEQAVSVGYGDDRTCYVTPNGYAYHSRAGCPRLSRSTEVYETTVGEAKDDGYEACDFCY